MLNALTASIAVLDHRGVIVAVNDSWQRFARENGVRDAAAFRGSNYLVACEVAVRGGDSTAQAVYAAFRALRDGNQDQFSIEYPCHSPTTQRWFEMRMTRSPNKPHYIVVAHENITVRKRMESELLRARQSIESFNAQLQEALAREQQNARTDELTGTKRPPKPSTTTACWNSRCRRKPQRQRRGSQCIERRLEHLIVYIVSTVESVWRCEMSNVSPHAVES